MQTMFEALAELVEAQMTHIVELRHKLHRCPEPGFCEVKTSHIIADELSNLGLKVQTGVAETGIIADLAADQEGPYVAIRADMDALALRESTALDYASENEGYSHACGHDGHSAAVVGAARVLAAMRDMLCGKVRFIFQPAEEICRGAVAMIEQGVLGPKPPDAILGLHAWPGIPVGSVACRAGTMMASCDVLSIRIHGKGGHGARPEMARNPLPGLARVVQVLTELTGAERVVSLCVARAGEQANVIADHAQLSGTVRTLSPQVRRKTLAQIMSLAENACTQMGLRAEVSFDGMSRSVVTDDRLYAIFKEVARELLGEESVVELESASMGSEDFGMYLDYVPGLIFRVGMGVDHPGLHRADFDFADAALRTGTLVLCGMAARICGKGPSK